MLRRLLAPANGPDRSLRAVGPYIEIGHQSAPDRQFPHAPFGSWFVSQIIPAAPNARRGPAPASQHTATHNHAPRGRVTGSQRTPNRRSVRPQPDSSGRRNAFARRSAASIDVDRDSGSVVAAWSGSRRSGPDNTASPPDPRVITSIVEAGPPTHHHSPAVPRRTPSRALRPSAPQTRSLCPDRGSDHPSRLALHDSCSPTSPTD